MKKVIIFDLDGTLADTILDIRDGLNGMLTELGFPSVTKEQTLNAINNGATELVRRCLPEQYKENEELVKSARKTYEKYYSVCYNNLTYAYEGASQALASLQESGATLCVLSNKQDEFVKKIVKKLFPSIKFAFVMGQTEKFPTKPSPASVNYILDSLGIEPREAVLVGDSGIDMETAKNAGIDAIGVSWGYRPPEMLKSGGALKILSNPAEFAEIINIFK